MKRHPWRAACAVILLSATALASTAQPRPMHPADVPMEDLKGIYLACDQAAKHTMLDLAAAIFCSRYSEELLRRGFAGDFNSLLAWWRDAKEAALATEDAEMANAPADADQRTPASR